MVDAPRLRAHPATTLARIIDGLRDHGFDVQGHGVWWTRRAYAPTLRRS